MDVEHWRAQTVKQINGLQHCFGKIINSTVKLQYSIHDAAVTAPELLDLSCSAINAFGVGDVHTLGDVP